VLGHRVRAFHVAARSHHLGREGGREREREGGKVSFRDLKGGREGRRKTYLGFTRRGDGLALIAAVEGTGQVAHLFHVHRAAH
jgi:hypothetical protein